METNMNTTSLRVIPTNNNYSAIPDTHAMTHGGLDEEGGHEVATGAGPATAATVGTAGAVGAGSAAAAKSSTSTAKFLAVYGEHVWCLGTLVAVILITAIVSAIVLSVTGSSGSSSSPGAFVGTVYFRDSHCATNPLYGYGVVYSTCFAYYNTAGISAAIYNVSSSTVDFTTYSHGNCTGNPHIVSSQTFSSCQPAADHSGLFYLQVFTNTLTIPGISNYIRDFGFSQSSCTVDNLVSGRIIPLDVCLPLPSGNSAKVISIGNGVYVEEYFTGTLLCNTANTNITLTGGCHLNSQPGINHYVSYGFQE